MITTKWMNIQIILNSKMMIRKIKITVVGEVATAEVEAVAAVEVPTTAKTREEVLTIKRISLLERQAIET